MKIEYVKASEIQVGDSIVTEDSTPVVVTTISPGMIRGTLMLSWVNGFSSVRPNDILEKLKEVIENEM